MRKALDKMALSVMSKWNRFVQEEEGDTNFISIIVILGIVLVVGALFVGFKETTTHKKEEETTTEKKAEETTSQIVTTAPQISTSASDEKKTDEIVTTLPADAMGNT